MTFDLNIGALLQHLRDNNAEPQWQKETDQVYLTYKIQKFDVPVFLLIRPDSELLQIVGYLPYQPTAQTISELARLLHLINRELDMPGFGMDENEKLVFFRSVIPCLSGKVDIKLFQLHLGVLRIACDTFMHAIGLVASGTMKVDEVLKEGKKTQG